MNGRKQVADPLSADEFADLIGRAEPGNALAIAVSGGTDSMVLAALCRAWVERHPEIRLHALIVDHGFRPESADEAQLVHQRLQDLDIPAEILRRMGEAPPSARQEIGRQTRYRLMADWCLENGFSDLLVAHHREDQAETVMMRILAGTGVSGLGAMRVMTDLGEGIRLLRPLLDISRVRLEATRDHLNIPHVEDPSNKDDAYLRTRIRHWLSDEGPLPVNANTPGRLAQLARRAARADAALERMTEQVALTCVTWHRMGWVEIDRTVLQAQPDEIALRILARAGAGVGGVPLPLGALERAWPEIANGAARTLGQVELHPIGDQHIRIWRQVRNLPRISWSGDDHEIVWDNRFMLHRNGAEGPVEVTAALDRCADNHGRSADRIAQMTAPAVDGIPVPVVLSTEGAEDHAGVYATFLGIDPGPVRHDVGDS